MKPLYLLFGEEKFLIGEELRRIKAEHKEAALEVHEDLPADKLLELLSVPSLFAAQRLLILKGFDLGQDDEKLSQAFSSISGSDAVILLEPVGLDKRKKVFKVIKKLAEVIECRPYADWQMDQVVEWVIEMTKRHKKKISFEDAESLVEICGRDLSILASEVEKIAVYAGEKPDLKSADIEAVATRAGIDAFGLALALRYKKSKPALRALMRLLSDKEDPIPLLGLLASQYRMLYRIKYLKNTGASQQSFPAKVGASPYYIKKLSQVADDFTMEELEDDLRALLKCDLSLKAGGKPGLELPLLALELLNA